MKMVDLQRVCAIANEGSSDPEGLFMQLAYMPGFSWFGCARPDLEATHEGLYWAFGRIAT